MDTPLVHFLVFALTGLPLVLQDRRSQSVSQWLLFSTLAVWFVLALASGRPDERWLLSILVLVAGTLFLVLLPDRLGEADVLFAAGMACVLPFFSWLTAMMAGCLGGLVAFGWIFWFSRASIQNVPVPFLPCLYWGGLTVLLGDLLV
jgi:Flp pilus assembly protein protease CpaA